MLVIKQLMVLIDFLSNSSPTMEVNGDQQLFGSLKFFKIYFFIQQQHTTWGQLNNDNILIFWLTILLRLIITFLKLRHFLWLPWRAVRPTCLLHGTTDNVSTGNLWQQWRATLLDGNGGFERLEDFKSLSVLFSVLSLGESCFEGTDVAGELWRGALKFNGWYGSSFWERDLHKSSSSSSSEPGLEESEPVDAVDCDTVGLSAFKTTCVLLFSGTALDKHAVKCRGWYGSVELVRRSQSLSFSSRSPSKQELSVLPSWTRCLRIDRLTALDMDLEHPL